MKEIVVKQLEQITNLKKEVIEKMIESPPSPELGDFAFPCFTLAKEMKKNPVQIAQELSKKIKSSEFEKVEAKGPYINFFLDKNLMANNILNDVIIKKEKYGSSDNGKGKKIVIDLSSPNIAKPFGIGHLRSTIIGSSISNIASFSGYKTIKINYLGDWGTQFGKLISGYKHFGNPRELKKNPIRHLLDVYVKVNKDAYLEQEARDWFKKLEKGDKEAVKFWKMFKKFSLEEFNHLYKLLNVKFDVISGESLYNNKMENTINLLEKKGLLEKSDGAQIVNLEKYGLGVCLIKKSDGATLYATRDLTAAIDRYNNYKFEKMIYEVGAEQKLYFRQLFKVIELLGFDWAEKCVHIEHGLYLDKDGKKFATREGKTIFMEEIINETKILAEKEIKLREKLSKKELDKRALSIAIAAIIYGDLKNYRANNVVFDLNRFISFEGDSGPYLLYSYARSMSILRKAGYSRKKIAKADNISSKEKNLIMEIGKFPEVVNQAYIDLSPNLIANYTFHLAQLFSEFYHSEQVIGSDNEKLRLVLVDCFSQVLKNALNLLGIQTIEKM